MDDNFRDMNTHTQLLKGIGYIDQEKVEVIIDTGCFKSVIPEFLVNQLNLEIESVDDFAFAANDQLITVKGSTVDTPFQYANTYSRMSFIILPRQNILLGMDWLTLNNAIIDFSNRLIGFKEQPTLVFKIENPNQPMIATSRVLSKIDQTNEVTKVINEDTAFPSYNLVCPSSFREDTLERSCINSLIRMQIHYYKVSSIGIKFILLVTKFKELLIIRKTSLKSIQNF